MEKDLRIKEIERSIIKKYRSKLWSKFVEAIDEYKLINEGDKIAVCISGGKDSFLMAKLFQELKKHWTVNFDLVFLVMDPGYIDENKNKILENAKILDIPIEIFETKIFDIVYKEEKSPCYLCARMRRGYLYREAKKRGCNKIALGHHFNDVIETTLVSMLFGSQVQTMMPKLKSTNVEGMQLIRPMYKIKEKDIIAWAKSNDLSFLRCACRFTERVANIKEDDSMRLMVKELIESLNKKYPHIDINIFKSMSNVNLNMVLGYKKDDKDYYFLDDYDE